MYILYVLCYTLYGYKGGMGMLPTEVYSATDVRQNWSDIIDIVQKKPIKVSRNKKNNFSIVSMSMWEFLLKDYNFNITIEKDTENYLAYFEDIKLVASESTKEETLKDLKEQLVEYADLFIEDLDYFSKDEERMKKLPHLLKVWLFPDNLDDFLNINGI